MSDGKRAGAPCAAMLKLLALLLVPGLCPAEAAEVQDEP